jgi:hypothetical protein
MRRKNWTVEQGERYVSPSDAASGVQPGVGLLDPKMWKEDLRPNGYGHGRRGNPSGVSGYFNASPSNGVAALPDYFEPRQEDAFEGGLVFAYRDFVRTPADIGDLVDISYEFEGRVIDTRTGETLASSRVRVRVFAVVGGCRAEPVLGPVPR